jgi:hypothetical protein
LFLDDYEDRLGHEQTKGIKKFGLRKGKKYIKDVIQTYKRN